MRYLILTIAFLSGCSSVVPSGIARLNAVSPMDADPADIGVSLTLPEGVAIIDGSAILTLAATRSDTNETTEGTYVLASMTATDGSQIYAVDPVDHAKLRDQQALIRQWESKDSDATTGSLSVPLAGCQIGAGPAKDATVSIRMRTAEDGPYFPIIRNAPVREVLQKGRFDPLQPCPETAD